MLATTAPAATVVDNRTGDATSIDARAFGALKAFLRGLGAVYTDEGGRPTPGSPRARRRGSRVPPRGRSRG